jgi:hypothetical protein
MAMCAAALFHLSGELVAVIALVAVFTAVVLNREVEPRALLSVTSCAGDGQMSLLEGKGRGRVLVDAKGGREEACLFVALAALAIVSRCELSVVLVVVAIGAAAELEVPPPVVATKPREMTLVTIGLGMKPAKGKIRQLMRIQRHLPREPMPTNGAMTSFAVATELRLVDDPVAVCTPCPLTWRGC